MKKKIFMILLVGTIGALTSACEIGVLGSMMQSYYERNAQQDYLQSIAAAPELDKQTKKMVARADKSLIYYYGSGYKDYQFMTRLYLDDACVGRNVISGGYYFWQLTPGKHTFELEDTTFSLDTIGGITYYIQEKRDTWSGKMKIELVDSNEGRSRLQYLRLLVSDGRKCGPSRASVEDDSKMKNIIVPEDNVLIYLYWPWQSRRPRYDYIHTLYLDHTCVGHTVTPGGYFVWILLPGTHTLSLDKDELVLNTRGGETYFIEQMSSFSSYFNMYLVDSDTGRKAIRAARLQIADKHECLQRSEIDFKMRNLPVPEDKVLVYLYRNEQAYNDYDATVHLDDDPAVEMAAGTYVVWQLTPGTHTVESGREQVIIDAKGGATYYIRLKITHGMLLGAWHHSLQIMGKEEGRKGVEESLLRSESPKSR